MSSSSSRSKPTRSRVSSPHRHSSGSVSHSHSRGGTAGEAAGGGGGGGGGGRGDGSRLLMQRWLEPPVQNKPSFQEAGLVRGGVVENMAPLGTMPKTTMLKKAPVATESPGSSTSGVTRIVLKKSCSSGPAGTSTASPIAISRTTVTLPDLTRISGEQTRMLKAEDDDATTATAGVGIGIGAGVGIGVGEVAAGADASLSPSLHPSLPIPIFDDLDDDDYVPKKSKSRRAQNTSLSSTPTTHIHLRRQSHRHRSTHSSPAPPLVIDPTPDPTPVPTSPSHSDATSFHQLTREPDDKEQANKIVEIAVEEALRHYRYPTAWALRLLYDENSGDPQFVSMIEDIYYQRATPKTIRKFRHLIGEKKKEGKRENKGCHYFVPPSGNRFTPHKPEPAPYESLVKMDFANLLRDSSTNDSEVDSDGHVSKRRKTESGDERPAPVDHDDANPTATAATNGAASQGLKHESLPTRTHSGTAKSRDKKTRSGSVSSTSSLSSVPDDAIEDYDDFLDSVDGDHGEQPEGSNAQIPAGSMQPISAEQAKPAIKKQIISPNPVSEQSTPTPKNSSSRDSSMPAAVVASTSAAASTSGASHHTNQPIPTLKFHSRFAPLDDSAATLVRKKLAQKSETAINTKSVSVESFVREPLELDELPEEAGLIPQLPQLPAPPPEYAPTRTPAPVLSSRAARAAKRNHDEFDEASSPTASSFRADFEPMSARNSRAATPSNTRSSKKSRVGLRVKTSPMKKKGTSAGIPRGHGERPSPVGNGLPNNQDDNDDSCYTCGGNGELVCCDGCTSSFHFMCIDPPMDHGHIPDEWFCNDCQIRSTPSFANEYKGIFGPLTANLQRKNPRAFRLPEDIRDYFEGVKTGPEGEYEEIVAPKPKATKKNAEEAFDYYRVRNGDKAVLCHHCHKGATENRPIIPCSVCGLDWHLECVNPPLTLPPVLRTWRCPCHVDDLLNSLPVRLAPAHKFRKIKGLPAIDQCYSRGLANNGWIEVQNDSDDEAAWKEKKSFGRVYRVSAMGIKKDFISRVHQNREQSNTQSETVTDSASAAAPKSQNPEDRQAALALLQLARGPTEGVHQLVQAVMSQAAPDAIAVMAKGYATRIEGGNLEDADVDALQAILLQVDAVKKTVATILETRTNHASHEKSSTDLKTLTPSSISHDDSTVVDELKLELGSPQDAENRDANNAVTGSAMQLD